ncbi:tetratricopeptide repeat protein [Metapseudomonas otitidis]|uniref:tetratricopeptide repeat protein n=1 Tax=Metapseudomonas otitidis TaxID=319939 RepID=UPI00244BCEBE|nr:tetratricopeptide repeat protein [Pseudomonas otitidis]MDH0339877.1 sel1 repeat family protein [Pseudomonas otitidis]
MTTKLKIARNHLEHGRLSSALKILKPLSEAGNAEAMFLHSTFSIAKTENDEEFDSRRLTLLKKSADLGFPEAIYELAVCYDTGDLVDQDQEHAAKLFEKACIGGFPHAEFMHGLNLYYGYHGITRDENAGLKLIRRAQEAGVPEAHEFLEKIS